MPVGPISSNSASVHSLSHVEEIPISGLTNLVEEIGIDDFIDRTPPNRPFAPTMEHGLGLAFREKEFQALDPYISEHGIRRAATQEAQFENPNAELKWRETIGILDIGGGVGGAIPLAIMDGAYLALYYGFFCSTMLRYRRLDLESDGEVKQKFQMPTHAQSARNMPAGSEVEFVGQGRLNMGTGIAVGTGVALGPFWAGVAGIAPVTNESVKEYSVTVTSVDGKGRVRVILRKLNSIQTTAGILGAAGFISPGFNGAAINEEDLVLLVGNSSTVKATGMILDNTSVTVGLSASHLEKSTVIAAFDVDLNTQDGVQAYEDLLRLSPHCAYQLASKPDNGVEILTVKEHQTEFGVSGYVNFFGDKIFLSERIDREGSGQMVRRDGSQLLYRNKIYEKRYRNVFSGDKNISWEAISMKDSSDVKSDMFYHLIFERTDYEFVAQRLKRFFRVATALHVPEKKLEYSKGQEFQSFLSLVSKAAKVSTKFDIFFTKSGVKLLEACNQACAAGQYIQAKLAIQPKYAGFPCDSQGFVTGEVDEILSEYLELSSTRHLFGIGKFRERSKLRAQYLALTGREITLDAKIYTDALEFGSEIEAIKDAGSKGEPDQLFSRLGKMKGFHFAGAIAALVNICGRDNVVIQEMSIESRGARLGYREDARIKFPREVIYDELTSA